MSNHAITLDASQAKLLVQELMHLEKVRKTLLRVIPETHLAHGSDLWWAKSDLDALDDIKEKRYKKVKTHEELDRYLDSL